MSELRKAIERAAEAHTEVRKHLWAAEKRFVFDDLPGCEAELEKADRAADEAGSLTTAALDTFAREHPGEEEAPETILRDTPNPFGGPI